MKKLFNCFLLALLCLALPLASCSKDEPTSNENTENENENDNNISKDVVEVTSQADGKLVANGLIFEITSFTDNTAEVTGTSSEVNADNFTGGFEIPAYIKYQSQKYTVTTIGNKIFFEFKKMTSIKLPSKLVSIGDEAFRDCESLTSVTIPNSVTKIGKRAFYNCSALKEIQLPKSLNEIGEFAFYCAKLEKVYVESTTPPAAKYSSFSATFLIDGTLIVPKSAYNAYICTAPWCGFNNIYYDGLIEEEEIREAVDLGLSVKWASENIGARRHGSFGQYFAWGETDPQETYTEENSKWYGVDNSDLKAQGVIDSNGNLTAKYDAASVNWGGKWRMPTKDEILELIDKCTWTWTTENGVNGYKVTGPSGNSIFLPAAGYRYSSDLYDAGTYGYYWSSTARSNSSYACSLYFNSSNHDWSNDDRYYGQSVRPVAE